MITKTAFLQRLTGLPDGTALIGQQLGGNCVAERANYPRYIEALTALTGKTPAIIGIFLTGSKGTDTTAALVSLARYFTDRGVQIVQGYYEPVQFSVGLSYNSIATITSDPRYLADLDKLTTVLNEFGRLGILVLLNPFCEMTHGAVMTPLAANGGRWWYVGGQLGESFKAMWRFTHAYVSSRLTHDNVLWMFEPANTGYWNDVTMGYPGPAYVNLVGVSAYNDRMQLREPGDTETGYTGRGLATWNKLCALGHPIGFSQTGPDTRDGTWNQATAYLEGAAFFPECKYIHIWSSWSSDTVKVAIFHNQGAVELMQSPRIITRENLMIGGQIVDAITQLTEVETALRAEATAIVAQAAADSAAVIVQADAIAQTIVELLAADAAINAAADVIKIG